MSTRPVQKVYVARTPGLKCQNCGKDISERASKTKWCYECSHKVERERQRQHKEYHTKLEARDTVIISANLLFCPVCKAETIDDAYFCYHCGQRLKESIK